MAVVFDGLKFAQKKEKKLKTAVAKMKVKPKLAMILVGNDKASRVFVNLKKEAAERTGIKFELKKFSASASEKEIIDFIKEKNGEKETTGIIIQLPLPKKLNETRLRRSIHPFKDVDCLHPENLGLLMMAKPVFYPATVRAILEILSRVPPSEESLPATSEEGLSTGQPRGLTGREVVIVGASNLVGKPLAMVMSNFGATVTLCRSKTRDLAKHTREAEILITATGKPGLIKKEMVKNGAVVIDVGELKGDVAKDVEGKASFITPVPGGVGPVTVVSLLENMLQY